MFESEEVLRDLLHETPTLLLTGFPELDPRFCPDSPHLVSLGREIPLLSGPVDNLFIDPNGVLTLVECKGYWNSEIKRKVYSQAINYASDLQEMFLHFEGAEFVSEFESRVLATGLDAEFADLDALTVQLETSESLAGKNLADWRTQFLKRLESNVKSGVFRIIIACGPRPGSEFNYSSIRNLMRLMSFSERDNSSYDLSLMDVRALNAAEFMARLIWRRPCALPDIPLIAHARQDLSAAIERTRERFDELPAWAQAKVEEIRTALGELGPGYHLTPDTFGYTIKNKSTGRSTYTQILPDTAGLVIERHQIRGKEDTHRAIEENRLNEIVGDQACEMVQGSDSREGGRMYRLRFPVRETTVVEDLCQVLGRVFVTD